MIKILITGAFNSLNKGDEARVKSSIQLLIREKIDAYFGFYSLQPKIDREIYKKTNIQIVEKYKYVNINKKGILLEVLKGFELVFILFNAILSRISNKIFGILLRRNLEQYDVFMDLSGESLSDYFGQISLLGCIHPILLGIILRKKVVIFAQSIGPFDNRFVRAIVRSILNRVDLITVRDERSLNYLQEYNINRPPIHLTADPAFLLDSAPSERVNEIFNVECIYEKTKPLIGISISRGSFKRSISSKGDLKGKSQEYIMVMSETINYLIKQFDASIIFIPHVIIPTEDDRIVFEEVYQFVENKDRFKLITGDYTSDELKGIIGKCDLFIGSRMHTIIAATSMYVPAIAIAYSHKMPSLMKMLGQEKYVCDVMSVTFDELVFKIDEVWYNRFEISNKLELKMQKIKSNALQNAVFVKEILFKNYI